MKSKVLEGTTVDMSYHLVAEATKPCGFRLVIVGHLFMRVGSFLTPGVLATVDLQ